MLSPLLGTIATGVLTLAAAGGAAYLFHGITETPQLKQFGRGLRPWMNTVDKYGTTLSAAMVAGGVTATAAAHILIP